MKATRASTNRISTPARRGDRIVCLGGSAGALSGYRDVLHAVRHQSGLAFVVVAHRQRGFDHLLGPLLQKVTDMPVSTVVQGQRLQPDTVVLLPSEHDLTMFGGRLVLTGCAPNGRWPTTITSFLRSLAIDAGRDAIAVILSGLANDGSAALGDIKRMGGTTFAQSDAKCTDMPTHAIETGHVDFVLSGEAIGLALSGLSALQ